MIYKKFFLKNKLSFNEKYVFFSGLYELSKSGISILDSIEVLNFKNKDLMNNLKSNLNKGTSLESALRETNSFDELSLVIVNIGEEGGDLQTSYEKLASYYRELIKLRKKILISLIYPLILIFSILVLINFINYYFIPKIQELSNFNIENLKYISRKLFIFSDMLNKFKIEFIIMNLSLLIVFFLIFKEIFINRNENNIFFNNKVLAYFTKPYFISNIVFGYKIMMSSNIGIVNATLIMKKQIHNKYLKLKLKTFSKYLKDGFSIEESVKKIGFKDEKILYFIKIGEESGRLEEILNNIYYNCISVFKERLNYLCIIIEPILILIIALILGFVIIFIVVPIISYEIYM